MTKTRWTRAGALFGCAAVGALGLAGCGGGEDFPNEPRPPVPEQVTGVITDQRVTISPDSFGAGPAVITISNQTPDSHTVTLDGPEIPPEIVGPVNPQDTATIQKTLPEGTYEVEVGSEESVIADIEPDTITVVPSSESGSDDLQLP